MVISGQSFVQNAIGSNFGSFYVILDEFHHRLSPDRSSDAIAAKIRKLVQAEARDASVAVFAPLPLTGWEAAADSRS